jgi:hypothetical protein
MAPKKQFLLRLDPRLYEVLERWAADELRSVNAHIEFLLREAARRADRLPVGRTGDERRDQNEGGLSGKETATR